VITKNGITATGANFLEPQKLANAPHVDDTSFSGYVLAGGFADKRVFGRVFPESVYSDKERQANNGIPGIIYIANNITDRTVTVDGKTYSFTAEEIKQKAYVHELGNILSYILTGDGDYFGEKGGVPLAVDPKRTDKDTGAALEKCVFNTPKLIP
jgi:hypothetical protein